MPLQRNFLPAAPVGLALQLRHLAGIVRIVNLNACLSTFLVEIKQESVFCITLTTRICAAEMAVRYAALTCVSL